FVTTHEVRFVTAHEISNSKGYGRYALEELCREAKLNGIKRVYDNIALDNPSVKLFKRFGFVEEYRTDEIIMLRKDL
ncbi:MAG: GNAT family N-acetyltransferase, partial [Lachnospiraceae bacterium]|nr:GNAT family N-acetyltransferase [Lachnospiraceae bacterium]